MSGMTAGNAIEKIKKGKKKVLVIEVILFVRTTHVMNKVRGTEVPKNFS